MRTAIFGDQGRGHAAVVAGVVDRVLEIAQRIVGGAERDSERLATDRHRHVTGTERGRGAGVSGRCELFRFGEIDDLDRIVAARSRTGRSDEHTSELQSLMRISY